MANRGIPFKRSLMVNLTAGVILLGICLLGVSLVATTRSVEKLSGSLTRRVIATTDARLMGFFEPVQSAVEISAERLYAGDFERFPLDLLDRYFVPLVKGIPQLSSLTYAHANGDEYTNRHAIPVNSDEYTNQHADPAYGDKYTDQYIKPAVSNKHADSHASPADGNEYANQYTNPADSHEYTDQHANSTDGNQYTDRHPPAAYSDNYAKPSNTH